jgi:hypothetical protein
VFLVLRQAFRRIGGVVSFAVMMIAIGVLARALHRVAASALRKARPRRPSLVGTIIAIALLGEPLRRIAGDRARDTPNIGPIIALSLLAPAVRRIAPLALRVRAGFRALRHALSLDPPPPVSAGPGYNQE